MTVHPLVALVADQLVPGSGERWALPDSAGPALIAALLQTKDHPGRADGVMALTHAAIVLAEEEDSPAAAGVIMRALVEVRAELRLDALGTAHVERQLEQGLDRAVKRAPRIDARAPAGTLKALHLTPRPRHIKP